MPFRQLIIENVVLTNFYVGQLKSHEEAGVYIRGQDIPVWSHSLTQPSCNGPTAAAAHL